MSDEVIPLDFDELGGFLEDRMRIYLAGPLTANDAMQAELCRKIRIRAERVLRTRFTVYDRQSAKKRRPILKVIKAANIGRDVFRSRVLLKLSIDDLAAATDIRSCMLRRLERDDAVASTLTLAQLMRIAKHNQCLSSISNFMSLIRMSMYA